MSVEKTVGSCRWRNSKIMSAVTCKERSATLTCDDLCSEPRLPSGHVLVEQEQRQSGLWFLLMITFHGTGPQTLSLTFMQILSSTFIQPSCWFSAFFRLVALVNLVELQPLWPESPDCETFTDFRSLSEKLRGFTNGIFFESSQILIKRPF